MPFDLLPLAQSAPDAGMQNTVDKLARTPLSQIVVLVVVLTIVRLVLTPYLRKTPPHLRTAVYAGARMLNDFLDAIVYAAVFVFMIIRPFGVQAFLIPSGSMWPTLHVHDFIVANKAIYRYSDPKRNDVVVFRPPKDAVTGSHNEATQLDENGDVNVDFIKRCIGTPGDVVELRKGLLYRDGKRVVEPYIHYSNTEDLVTFTEKSPEEKANMDLASFKLVKRNGEIIPLDYTSDDANAQYPKTGYSENRPPYDIAPRYVISDPTEMKALMTAPAQPVPKGYYLMMGDNRNNSFDGRAWGLVPREWIIGRSEFIWFPFSSWGRTR